MAHNDHWLRHKALRGLPGAGYPLFPEPYTLADWDNTNVNYELITDYRRKDMLWYLQRRFNLLASKQQAISTSSTRCHEALRSSEVLILIFRLLNGVDLFGRKRVCRQWCYIIEHLMETDHVVRQAIFASKENAIERGQVRPILDFNAAYFAHRPRKFWLKISQSRFNTNLESVLGGQRFRVNGSCCDLSLSLEVSPYLVYKHESRYMHYEAAWRLAPVTSPPCRQIFVYRSNMYGQLVRMARLKGNSRLGVRAGRLFDALEKLAPRLKGHWLRDIDGKIQRVSTSFEPNQFDQPYQWIKSLNLLYTTKNNRSYWKGWDCMGASVWVIPTEPTFHLFLHEVARNELSAFGETMYSVRTKL